MCLQNVAVAAIAAVMLAGCGASSLDVYDPPPARPGMVMWMMAPQSQLPALCGHATVKNIVGCAMPKASPCLIITRPPSAEDWPLLLTLQHEVAHCQGWRHPAWPNGVA